MSRIVTPRRAKEVDPAKIQLPFVYLMPSLGYDVSKFTYRVQNDAIIDLGQFPSGFPSNVKEYYWIEEGIPGEKPWRALGKLNFGAFFFFTASCNKNSRPFSDGSGQFSIFPAYQYDNLIHYGLDYESYTKYIAATEPF